MTGSGFDHPVSFADAPPYPRGGKNGAVRDLWYAGDNPSVAVGDTSPYPRGGKNGAVEVKRELSSRPCGEIPSTIGAPNVGFFDYAQNDRR